MFYQNNECLVEATYYKQLWLFLLEVLTVSSYKWPSVKSEKFSRCSLLNNGFITSYYSIRFSRWESTASSSRVVVYSTWHKTHIRHPSKQWNDDFVKTFVFLFERRKTYGSYRFLGQRKKTFRFTLHFILCVHAWLGCVFT